MIPKQFQFLERIGPLPKLVEAALQCLGLKEIPGAKSNPVILNMAKQLGVDKIYTNDDTSWCALFMNYLFLITGKPLVIPKDLYDLLRALKTAPASEGGWQEVPYSQARLGDVVILGRDGGGHNTLFIAKAPNTFIGLGGNQSNAVTFAYFPDSRVIRIMRYYSIAAPASAKRYDIETVDELSKNEA